MTPDRTNGAGPVQLRATARRARLTVAGLLALVFLLLTGIAVASLWLRHEEVLRDGRARIASLAQILSEDLAVRFDAIEAALSQLADHNRRIGGPQAEWDQWLPVLGAALSGLTGVDSISVTDAKGTVTFSTRTETMGESHRETHLYESLSANPMSNALVTDAPFRSRFDTTMLVPVGRVLRTTNAEFEGMLIATLAPAQLASLYQSVDLGEGGVVWLLHPAGTVLFRQPPFGDLFEWPMPDIPVTPAEGSGTVLAPIEAGGPDYLSAYRTDGRTGLAVAISLPADRLLVPWREDALAAFVLLAAGGFLLVVAGFVIDGVVRRALATAAGPPSP